MPIDEFFSSRAGLPRAVGDFSVTRGQAPLTHGLAEVAEQMGAPSERWVVEQIRAGRFPARKIGRTWRMTQQDIATALDACGNTLRSTSDATDHLKGLTPTSRRRLATRGVGNG